MIGVVAPRDLPLLTFNVFAFFILLLGAIHPSNHPSNPYPVKIFKILVHPSTTHPGTKLASC